MKKFLSFVSLLIFVLILSQNAPVHAEKYENYAQYQVYCQQIRVASKKDHFVPDDIVRGFTNLVRRELIHNRDLMNNARFVEQTVVSKMEQCFPTTQPVLFYDTKSGKTIFINEIKQHKGTFNGYVGIFAKDNSTIESTDPIDVQQSRGVFKNTIAKEVSSESGTSRIPKMEDSQVKNGAKKP